MIHPSPELLAVSRRWYDAITYKRLDQLRNFLSDGDNLRFVGTAEDELWCGAAVREGISGFFGVIPEITNITESFAQAYENSDTGWSCFTHDLTFANQPDRSFHVRHTLVFALEGGSWKIVQRHSSVPIPNMEHTGTEQTAIADLIAAAQQGFSLNQNEGFASVMFTDIVNSSRLVSVMGDRLWSSEVAKHFAILRGIIQDAGGQFVKSLGDGTMSSFPSPSQALHAARAILNSTDDADGPTIDLHIGVHTGHVVQSDDDFFGTVVNKSARITAVAAPGEICVSGVTREMVEDASDFDFSAPNSVMLKGFDGEHLIHRLEWRK